MPSAIENAPHLQAIYQTVLNATIDSIHTKRTTHRGQGEHTANNAFPPKTLKQCRMSQQQKRKFVLRQRVKGTCHHREREDVHGGGRNRWVIRTHGFRALLVYLLALKAMPTIHRTIARAEAEARVWQPIAKPKHQPNHLTNPRLPLSRQRLLLSRHL